VNNGGGGNDIKVPKKKKKKKKKKKTKNINTKVGFRGPGSGVLGRAIPNKRRTGFERKIQNGALGPSAEGCRFLTQLQGGGGGRLGGPGWRLEVPGKRILHSGPTGAHAVTKKNGDKILFLGSRPVLAGHVPKKSRRGQKKTGANC